MHKHSDVTKQSFTTVLRPCGFLVCVTMTTDLFTLLSSAPSDCKHPSLLWSIKHTSISWATHPMEGLVSTHKPLQDEIFKTDQVVHQQRGSPVFHLWGFWDAWKDFCFGSRAVFCGIITLSSLTKLYECVFRSFLQHVCFVGEKQV